MTPDAPDGALPRPPYEPLRLNGSLALMNFERARATSDRLALPEVRLRVYMDIAQQAIQTK